MDELYKLPQWLIQYNKDWNLHFQGEILTALEAAMANPIQQGLKHDEVIVLFNGQARRNG